MTIRALASACALGFFSILPAMAQEAPAEELPAVIGVGLAVSDIEASVAFYTDGLGMTVLRRLEFDTMDEVIVGNSSGATILLLDYHDKTEVSGEAANIKVVMRVPDAAAFGEQIEAAGYELLRAPKDGGVPGVMAGFAMDPDGYKVEFYSMTAPD